MVYPTAYQCSFQCIAFKYVAGASSRSLPGNKRTGPIDKLTPANAEPPNAQARVTFMETPPRSTSATVGRKRRLDEAESQTPNARQKVNPHADSQVKRHKGDKKKPGALLLSSPTDVSDLLLVKGQVRVKQAKASGLPSLSLSPIETKANRDEAVSELEEEADALTPRPTVRRLRRRAQRPPLGRRAVVGNRARLGVGIVRCRSWRVNDEETETEDESPAPSPRRETSAGQGRFSAPLSVMEVAGCGCSGGQTDDETLEDQVGASVLPIDPSLNCFDHSYSEDEWQLRSPSPEEKFFPENSCCGEKRKEDDLEGEPSTATVEYIHEVYAKGS